MKPTAVIACAALAAEIRAVSASRGWEVELHPLDALMHDRPERIAPAVERAAEALAAEGKRVAVAYADCGSYGAIDGVCDRLGLARLPGLHCYDLLAGARRIAALLEEEPGTYLLTDFLVKSFKRTVVAELGLDRHPELAEDYFGHYRRVVWLAGSRSERLQVEAERIAALLGLPLERVDVGTGALEEALEELIGEHAPSTPAALG